MLYVTYAVHVVVYVDVAVLHFNRPRGRCFSYPYSGKWCNSAFLFSVHPITEPSAGKMFEVNRLSCLRIQQGPYRVRIPVGRAVGAQYGEAPVGESAVYAAYPCFDDVFLTRPRNFVHLDGKARNYPRQLLRQQLLHAEAAAVGVEACSGENAASEHVPRKTPGEILLERLYCVFESF